MIPAIGLPVCRVLLIGGALLLPAALSFQPSLVAISHVPTSGLTTSTSTAVRTSACPMFSKTAARATTTTNMVPVSIPTIDLTIVAYSGLRTEEVDIVQTAIQTACEEGLGLVVSVTTLPTQINSAISGAMMTTTDKDNTLHATRGLLVYQEASCVTPSSLPGALGRVLLLQTNLDVDSIETVEYAIAEQMDLLLYAGDSEAPLLQQPILIKIHNPQYSNIDFEDVSIKTLQLLVQDEVNIYQLNRAIDDQEDGVVHDVNEGDTNSTATLESTIPILANRLPVLPPAPSLHVELDGATVITTSDLSSPPTSWWDTSTVLVWDDLISDDLRRRLLNVVKGISEGSPSSSISGDETKEMEWDDVLQGPDPSRWTRGGLMDTPNDDNTARCWGLGEDDIEDICFGDHPAITEFERILSEHVFPQFKVCRLPEAVFGACVSPLTANAPTHGDQFDYHIDGDPKLTPPSPWTDVYGRYPNRQVGKPRFVSCLIYLNDEWKSEEWGAPTRFLDLPSSTWYDVLPRPGRCVVMDQDVSHTVVAPHAAAGRRPRYSLVWKLILHPREGEEEHQQDMRDLRFGRENWPEPIFFGSAATATATASC
jgi:2OG-Fe(II) oxygenase superfamily